MAVNENGDPFLEADGSFNLREIAFLTSMDGRRLRRGMLYRSGTLHGLTDEGQKVIAQLGLRTVCDFRSNSERAERPTRLPQQDQLAYWARDYEISTADIRELATAGHNSSQGAKDQMLHAYKNMPGEQAASYRHLFAAIIAGVLPILFKCSAGKDRTGVAAALVLDAIDIPREQILTEYALTQRAFAENYSQLGNPSATTDSEQLAWAPYLAADPDYITVMFDHLDAEFVSTRGYLRWLGFGEGEISMLPKLLLE